MTTSTKSSFGSSEILKDTLLNPYLKRKEPSISTSSSTSREESIKRGRTTVDSTSFKPTSMISEEEVKEEAKGSPLKKEEKFELKFATNYIFPPNCICVTCKNVPWNAIEISDCRCIHCDYCFQKNNKNNTQFVCICEKTASKYNLLKNVNARLHEVMFGEHPIYCPVNGKGCGQSMPYKDLENHIENECKMRLVPCEHCKQYVSFVLMKSHHTTYCRANVPCKSKYYQKKQTIYVIYFY